MVDLIGEGFDAAIRIAVLPDSSLVARRLCEMPRYLVGSPAYLNKHGRPKHPLHLAQHRCIGYSYTMAAETWRFTKGGKSASVRPSGPLRVNNGDAMMPALIAGHRPRHPAGIHFARRTRRRPAGEIAAGLVSPIWRRLLGDAARGAATEAGRSPRRFSGREACCAWQARDESGAGEHPAGATQSQYVIKARPFEHHLRGVRGSSWSAPQKRTQLRPKPSGPGDRYLRSVGWNCAA